MPFDALILKWEQLCLFHPYVINIPPSLHAILRSSVSLPHASETHILVGMNSNDSFPMSFFNPVRIDQLCHARLRVEGGQMAQIWDLFGLAN